MKGWRTIGYQVLIILGTIVAALLTVEWAGLGLEQKYVVIIVAVLKILDSLINVVLRLKTTTPVGRKL